MAGRYFGIPFATSGDKVVVPDATQPDGSVSFTQGFGFDYERPNTDPSYKPVPRDGTNGILHDITEAVGIIQRQGAADWTVDAQPYDINVVVRHSGFLWRSLVINNNVTPAEGASWTQIGVASSETVKGLIEIATTAEAQALTDDAHAITPKKLKDVLDVTSLGRGQVATDLTASRAFGVLYINTTGRPIYVSVYWNAGVPSQVNFYIDSVIIDVTGNGSTGFATSRGIVPPGASYQLATAYGSASVGAWYELR